MEKNITQLVEVMLAKISNIFYKNIQEGDIDTICEASQIVSGEFVKDIINMLITDLDKEIKKHKRRKEVYDVERNNYPRKLLTEIGELDLRRTLYINKNTKKLECLIDKAYR